MRLAVMLVFPFLCFSQQLVKLPGSLHPKALAAYDIGPADPSQPIGYVSVMLKRTPAQEADLEAFVLDQQNPASANFHGWLTPERFADRFGATQADIAKISTWLKSRNLKIENTARGRDWIAVSGTVAQIQTAFRTTIRRYKTGNEEHFANATAPNIPREFAANIQLIRGLNDFYPTPNGIAHKIQPDYTNSAGRHYLAPDDWAAIYDVTKLYNLNYTGTGQRIVVIGTSDIVATDISQFRALFGLPVATIEKHLPLGATDPGVSSNTQGEANLDLEWSGAVARGATIVYDYAKSLYDAVQDAVDNARAPVMTMSFGGCDASDGGISYYRSIYALKANAQGMTWLASSGDSGPANCDAHASTAATHGLSANFPASIPEVTGIGGTQFNEGTGTFWSATNGPTLASALGYLPEMVWNESGSTGLWSSGGGPSALFSKPSWQTGPGVPNDGARDTPDLALSSAAHDGYRVVLNGDASYVFSGTSASTPSFAGVLAILNQYLVGKGIQSQPGLGNINPTLYGMWSTTPSAFHDITVGDNMILCKVGTPQCTTGTYGYTATPGYDLVTGIGSVDAFNLVTNWKSVTPKVVNSLVTANIAPSPVYQMSPDSSGFTYALTVTLTESNGGQTTLNSFSIGNASYNSSIVSFFGTNIIPANGFISADIGYKTLTTPVTFSFTFAGTDVSGRTWTQSVPVEFLPAQTGGTKITGVANGASFQTTFSPGMEMSVFGTQLSTTAAAASSLPLPSTLGGATAAVNGVDTPFYYASPGQLNVQIPYSTATGTATLSVSSAGQTSTFPFTVSAASPGIYVGTNSVLVPLAGAARNTIVSLYMTGTGAQNPPIAAGAAPAPGTPLNQLPQPVAPYSISVGGVPATFTFFGIPPFLVGVTQVNFTVPPTAPLGVQPVIVTVGGVKSAAANLTIAQ